MADSLVLCYHAVSDAWDQPMAVRPAALRSQLVRLLRKGFRAVTFSEAVRSASPRTVAITFDDGFRSTYDRALPILAELEVPATVFVPTALMGGGPLAWPGFDAGPSAPAEELLPLSWAQVAELAAAGWEVGAHSRTHPRLTAVDDDTLWNELAGARQECERQMGQPCRTVAYPFGDLDERVQQAAGAAGYTLGAALGPHRARPGPLAVPRVGVYRCDSPARFALKVSGVMRGRTGRRAVPAGKSATRLLHRSGSGADQASP